MALRLNQVLSHLTPPNQDTVNHHDLNPAFFVPRSAEIEPNALAVVHGSVKFTYKQFAERVSSLAHYFKHHGLKRIAIVAPNTPAHLETMFAANAAGGIIMGINYRLTKKEIAYKLDLGQADCIVVDYEMIDLVSPVDSTSGKPRKIIVDYDFTDPPAHKNNTTTTTTQYSEALQEGAKCGGTGWSDLHTEYVDETSVLGYFFTSGTTGLPKAVEYTHRGVYLAAMANIIDSNLNSADAFGNNRCNYLWTLPMFHAAGWTYPYAVTAARGTHYCLRKIDPTKIWQLLTQCGITHFNAAPTVNTMLLNCPQAVKLKQQVRVIVAASPPSAKLFQDMIDVNLFPVHMYGLTETYGPFAISYYNPDWNSLPQDEKFAKMARQGFGFITSSKLRVVDEKLQDVEPDGKQIGEIVVRGNIVAKGYYRNPEETAKSFGGGWFKSGDLAVVHPDGSCQVLDRKKDIIISGGENISSVVVENVLVKHAAVLEAAVVGVPDQVYGERPVACVVLKNGQKLTTDELVAFAKEHLGGYQVPRSVMFLEGLPKTATGKVRKNILRDQAAAAGTGAADAITKG